MKLKLLLLSVTSFVLVSCTGSPSNQNSKILIRLPLNTEVSLPIASSEAVSKTGTVSTMATNVSGWGLQTPDTPPEIGCYAIAVELPEVRGQTICSLHPTGAFATPYVIGGFAAPGETLSVDVPMGENRKFILMAFRSSNGCPSGKIRQPIPKHSLSAPVVVGLSYADILPGVTSVTIKASMSNSVILRDCAWPTPLAFTVEGITGGSDTIKDNLLTAGFTPTVNWTNSAYTKNYEVTIFQGSTATCGPQTVAAPATSLALTGCTLSEGITYTARVIASDDVGNTIAASNNDFSFSAPIPSISIAASSVDHGGIALIPFTLTRAPSSALTLTYSTVDGNGATGAIGDTDFGAKTGQSITFPAETLTGYLPVQTYFNWNPAATNLDFSVSLLTSSYGALGTTTAAVTITHPYQTLTPALFTQIDAGGIDLETIELQPLRSHTCGVTPGGAAKCWGDNSQGQLGNGTTTDSYTPVQVIGLTAGVSQISAGTQHTCAVLSDQTVRCWGKGTDGRLGHGLTTDSNTPVQVVGLSNIIQVSAADSHSCAVTSTGSVYCWGSNSRSQLGVGSGATPSSSSPILVSGVSNASQVASGGAHTCVLLSTGGVQCWGWNSSGQLGDNSTTNSVSPRTVLNASLVPLAAVAKIVAGDQHTCGLLSGASVGTVFCWGLNGNGQLGDGTEINRSVATQVSGGLTFTDLNAHISRTCFVRDNANAYCTGSNGNGQIGDGTKTKRLTPTLVLETISPSTSLNGVVEVAVGQEHTCARDTSNQVHCWGAVPNLSNSLTAREIMVLDRLRSSEAALGNGLKSRRYSRPVVAKSLASLPIKKVAAGAFHTCVLHDTGGGISCWGLNDNGALGNNSQVSSYLPVNPGPFTDATDVVAGFGNTCAIAGAPSSLYCWGGNTFGQLGMGNTNAQLIPNQVSLPNFVSQVSMFKHHTCAILIDGALYCWGRNNYGQLGDGTLTQRNSPVLVSFNSGTVLTSISVGETHTCAVTSSNSVYCWGNNEKGQLGLGSYTNHSTPQLVNLGGDAAVSVSVGQDHSCALLSNNRIKCWGGNLNKQVANVSDANLPSPVDAFSGLNPSAISVSVSGDTTCYLTDKRVALCKGENTFGQLGINSEQLISAVAGIVATQVDSYSLGRNHGCAVQQNRLICWGENTFNQLGTEPRPHMSHVVE